MSLPSLAPAMAFLQARDAGDGLHQLALGGVPGVDASSRIFLVPVGPSGVLGSPSRSHHRAARGRVGGLEGGERGGGG